MRERGYEGKRIEGKEDRRERVVSDKIFWCSRAYCVQGIVAVPVPRLMTS